MAVPPRKKRPSPGVGDGGVRVDSASDRPRRGVALDKTDTNWLNPKEPLPSSVTNKLLDDAGKVKAPPTIIEKALAAMGGKPDDPIIEPTFNNVLAAVIIAQALDRLGEKIITAAAVSRGIQRGT